MKSTLAAILFASLALPALAQMTPVGTWHTMDEKTGEIKSQIVISEAGGVVSGKIDKVLRKDAKPDAVCDECSDDRKGKPIVGLDIIRGAKKAAEKNVWEGGKILDPENGKNYTLTMEPEEGGKKLKVRGYIGPFFRTQTWVRVP
jgi:uncharacterized protein (DUF2147 family)